MLRPPHSHLFLSSDFPMSILKKLYFQNVLLPIPNAIGRNIPATHSQNLAEKFLHDFRAFRCFNAKNRKKSKNFKFNRSCSYFNCALPWWSPTSTENLGPTGQSTWEEIVPQQTNRQTTGIPQYSEKGRTTKIFWISADHDHIWSMHSHYGPQQPLKISHWLGQTPGRR